jgi:hypothetical protein
MIKQSCCSGRPDLVPDVCHQWTTLPTTTRTATIANGYNYLLQVVVVDSWGYTVSRELPVNVGVCYPNPDPDPPACPFVWTWNGSEYIEDNNILPQSQYSANKAADVADWYVTYTKPVAESGSYRLRIAENGNELSFIDRCKLLLVDHPPDITIGVDDAGAVMAFAKPAVLAQAELDSHAVLDQVAKLDEQVVSIVPGETLSLNFVSVSESNGDQGLMVLGEGPIKEETIALVRVSGKPDETNPVGISVRHNPSVSWARLEPAVESERVVDLLFEHPAEVDVTQLCASVDLAWTPIEVPLFSAVHSQEGDVRARLIAADSVYATVRPGEHIELAFDAPPPSAGLERSFVFYTRGRYFSLNDSAVVDGVPRQSAPATVQETPRDYAVFAPYPNPANPRTLIRFELPERSYVSLQLYDVLGRRVAQLADGFYSEGTHQVEYNGAALASGLYLARFTAAKGAGGEVYTRTHKLVLVK